MSPLKSLFFSGVGLLLRHDGAEMADPTPLGGLLHASGMGVGYLNARKAFAYHGLRTSGRLRMGKGLEFFLREGCGQ